MRYSILFITILFFLKVNAQVNLRTGASEISIPIFSYSDNSGLQCGGSLDYVSGNGLKVNDLAPAVGTGWNLNCGGSIDRIQNGEADDQKQFPGVSYPYSRDNYFPNGFLYSSFPTTDIVDNNAGLTPFGNFTRYDPFIPIPKYTEDREQDYFNFTFNNHHGTFVIGRNGEIKILGDSRLKILKKVEDQSIKKIRTTIVSFTILDENGIQYIFSDQVLTEVCKYDLGVLPKNGYVNRNDDGIPVSDGTIFPPCPGCQTTFNVYQARPLSEYVTTSWCLTKINNPRSGKFILFNYEDVNIDYRGAKSLIMNQTTGQMEVINLYQHRNLVKFKRLTQIITPRNEIYYFLYDRNNTRVDLIGDRALLAIECEKNNKPFSSFKFAFGYFCKRNIRDYQETFNSNESIYTRLCLLSIQKHGSDGKVSENPYLFNYNTGEEYPNIAITIPPRYSFDQDQFGFYTPNLEALPIPNFDANQLSFYTGGFHDYFNRLDNPASYRTITENFAKNGIINSVKYPTGGMMSFDYEQRDNYYNGQNIKVGGVRVKTTKFYDGINHKNDIETNYEYKDISGNSSGWGYELPIFKQIKTSTAIKDKLSHSGLYIAGQVLTGIQKTTPLFSSSFQPASSLGTAQMANLALFIIQVVFDIIEYFSADSKDFETTLTTFEPLNGNMLPCQYSFVSVSQMSAGFLNGKVTYRFTKPVSKEDQHVPYPHDQRISPWEFGLPLEIFTYRSLNNSFSLVKSIENKYETITNNSADQNFLSKKWEVIRPVALPYTIYKNIIDNGPTNYINGILTSSYYTFSARTQLSSTTERAFNATGNFVQNITEYSYNEKNYQISAIRKIDSKGDLSESKIYYPEDYSSAGIISSLIENNMVNIPLSTETWLTKKWSNNAQLLNCTASKYSVIPNGDIKLSEIFSLESSTPLTASSILPFNPSDVVRDPNYIKSQATFSYDQNGNQISTSSKGNTKSSLFDFNNKSLIMSVSNANKDEFAYTSFEHLISGGWTYDLARIVVADCPTGKSCLSLISTYNLSTQISINKPFILSFWCKGNQPVVNNGLVPVKTISGNSGWNYYEYNLPVNSQSPVISGTTLIDELRLYPKDSKMVTYSYDDFENKISECDQNNYLTNFEYDGLNRLLVIKDENKNILKKYCYTNAGQSESCTTIFTNDLKSKTFTRNNCSPGLIPTSVIYTVPEGKYTSILSKDDANQKARQDLDNNGQNYANTSGECRNNIIYAKLGVGTITGNIAEITVTFYEDINGTIPVNVTDMNILYQVVTSNSTIGNDSVIHDNLDHCNGSTVILFPQYVIHQEENDEYHTVINTYFALDPSNRYIIIN